MVVWFENEKKREICFGFVEEVSIFFKKNCGPEVTIMRRNWLWGNAGLDSFLGGNRLGMSLAHFKIFKVCHQWAARTCLSVTASAHFEAVGPGQFGERCWQECYLSSTHAEKMSTRRHQGSLRWSPMMKGCCCSNCHCCGSAYGAAEIEVRGDIVKSAVGALDMWPKAPNARESVNNANTTIKRLNPTLQRDSPDVKKKHFLIFEGWGRRWFFIRDLKT